MAQWWEVHKEDYQILDKENFQKEIRGISYKYLNRNKKKEFNERNSLVTVKDNSIKIELSLYKEDYIRDGALGLVYEDFSGNLLIDQDQDIFKETTSSHLEDIFKISYDDLISKRDSLLSQFKGLDITVDNNLFIGSKNSLNVNLIIEIGWNIEFDKNDELIDVFTKCMKRMF